LYWKFGALTAGLFCVVISSAVAEDEIDTELKAQRLGVGNLDIGQQKAHSELCVECHGERGLTDIGALGVPHLAGQYAAYLEKQLNNFKSGERKHEVMNPMAESLKNGDIIDIVSYFSTQPNMHSAPQRTQDLASQNVAQNLFMRGDSKRNILSCKSCHGVDGKGGISANDVYPVIAGQRHFYLREQLLNWRSKSRSNSPGQVMNVIAKSLSDAEIEALAEYISSMP
jgi:cytochrome c553